MKFEKNEIVTVTIEDIGSEGEGIGRAEGFTLFVKDAVAGDTVEARIVKCKKNYAYARLEKVLVPSPFRVEPRCRYHRQCGGCQLQALSYERQLSFKQDKISNSLIRIGGFAPEYVKARMEPIVGMEEPFRYRNKAQYPIGTDREGNPVAGFYAGRTHSIIANTDCQLGPVENEEVLQCILRYMQDNGVSAYDEETGKGLIRHILIRKGFSSGEMMVCLVINKRMTDVSCSARREKSEISKGLCAARFLPRQEELIASLTKIKGMTSVSVSLNAERTNVIMGKEIHTLWGRDTISDTIRVRDMGREGYPFTGEELHFHISPLSFYQVNPLQTEKLYSLALEYAGLTGRETVWDLYCGIGTISLFLAGSAKRVYGVEIIPQAIHDARENAARNNITNAEFFVGGAEDVLQILEGSAEAGQRGDEGRVVDAEERRQSCGMAASAKAVLQGGVLGGAEERRQSRGMAVSAKAEPQGGVSGGAVERRQDGGTPQIPAPDVVVVDPPRKGCDSACLSAILEMQPHRIVYVSCDPATLARDLRVLCDGGYELERIRGVDQFGMTVHVEVAVLLCRADT